MPPLRQASGQASSVILTLCSTATCMPQRCRHETSHPPTHPAHPSLREHGEILSSCQTRARKIQYISCPNLELTDTASCGSVWGKWGWDGDGPFSVGSGQREHPTWSVVAPLFGGRSCLTAAILNSAQSDGLSQGGALGDDGEGRCVRWGGDCANLSRGPMG